MVNIRFSSACKFVKGSRLGRKAAEEPQKAPKGPSERPQSGRKRDRKAAENERKKAPKGPSQRPQSGRNRGRKAAESERTKAAKRHL